MAIDRSDFLILATTLAAGGAGGWFFRDQSPAKQPPPAAPAPAPKPSAPPVPSGSVPVTIVDSKSAAAPACDDAQGTPEPCPSIGPADEGICGNIIFKRCNEFKTAFKPRVATNAVACLRALKGYERCDPLRINQCGHMALMAACQEPVPLPKGQLQFAADGTASTVTLAPDATAPASPVSTACDGVHKACNKLALDPTLGDCRQTLAGMNDLGRASLVDCVSTHCTDRGLYLCEGVPKLPGTP